MNRFLWLLQIVLSIEFFFTGIVHLIIPPGLPAILTWIYALPAGLHYFIGTVEILAVLGLILPGLTHIQTRLTPLAALGLVPIMAGAIVWHATRNEFSNILLDLVLAGMAGFVAYRRWKLNPLKDKSAL